MTYLGATSRYDSKALRVLFLDQTVYQRAG